MNYDFYIKIDDLYYQCRRLPSGFGTVRFLGQRRSNPYAVHPPMFMTRECVWRRPPAICYVPDKLTGYKILALYHEGLYSPGLEQDKSRVASLFLSLVKKAKHRTGQDQTADFYKKEQEICSSDQDTSDEKGNCIQSGYANSPLTDSQSPDIIYASNPAIDITHHRPSLREVYLALIDFKYGKHASRRLSPSSRSAAEAAYGKLKPFYDYALDDISIVNLQNLVNRTAAEGYSRSSLSNLVTLIRHLYRFAYPREMCTKEYGRYVQMPYTDEESHHQDFNDEELQILWKHKDDPIIGMVLIMCYSGFRIGAFAPENGLQTFLSPDGGKGYFRGGIKTKVGGKESFRSTVPFCLLSEISLMTKDTLSTWQEKQPAAFEKR